jgi:hypothetical protein
MKWPRTVATRAELTANNNASTRNGTQVVNENSTRVSLREPDLIAA